MNLKAAGIILSKAVWRERDLRATLLLRRGQQVTAIFYGGQGGGPKSKASGLDLGHSIDLELSAKAGQELWTALEWKERWAAQEIRHHWPSFCLMCFILEILASVAPHGEWTEDEGEEGLTGAASEFKDLFVVGSNALYYLEQALKRGMTDFLTWHWAVFLGKLLLALGLAPRFTHCCFCQRPLANLVARWLPAEGGFSCAECLGQTLDGQNDLWHRYWQQWAFAKYGDLCQKVAVLPPHGEELSNYFFYQTDLRPEHCKSWPLLLAAGLGLHCR